VRRARVSAASKGPGPPREMSQEAGSPRSRGSREPGPELEPTVRPAMIPFGLVLTTPAALVPEPGCYLPRASAAVQGFRPFPARDASLRTPGLAHSQAYSRGGSRFPASWTPSSHASRTWVRSGSRVSTISPPSYRRRWHGSPWLLSRRPARSRSACAPTRHATRRRPGAAAWWTVCPPTSSRTSVGGGITLAVQLCDPPLPLPQPQSEHATVEGKRPVEVPQLTATEQIPVS